MAEFPSASVTSPIEIVTGVVSSFRMVPVPWPSAIVAFTGLDKVRVKVSSASTAVSPLTGTGTVFVVSPAAKVSVPEVDV